MQVTILRQLHRPLFQVSSVRWCLTTSNMLSVHRPEQQSRGSYISVGEDFLLLGYDAVYIFYINTNVVSDTTIYYVQYASRQDPQQH